MFAIDPLKSFTSYFRFCQSMFQLRSYLGDVIATLGHKTTSSTFQDPKPEGNKKGEENKNL